MRVADGAIGFTMTEAEYWAEFETVQQEVALAIECFYAHEEMNNYAAENPAVLRGFNEAAFFWITVRYSLLTTFFITLGRLFDEDGDTLSLGKLLRATAEHPDYFSKEALAERKRRAFGGGEPDMAGRLHEGYLAARGGGFEEHSADALGPWRRKYEALYQPIRHKVFAHKVAAR